MTPAEASPVDALPTHLPGARERADLELLRHGALAPTEGFGGPDGLATLEVATDLAERSLDAGGLVLIDAEGAPQAVVRPSGAIDTGRDTAYLVGPVEPLPYDGTSPFARLRRSPADVRRTHGGDYLLVPVSRPLTARDLRAVGDAARGADVVLLVLYGVEPGPRGSSALVRATLSAASDLPRAAVVVAPTLGRGPRTEALIDRVVDNYAVADVMWPVRDPDVSKDDAAQVAARGLVLFFTGLSGSGKSTVARAVQDVLLEQHDRPLTSLDGDVVRRNLSEGLGFSADDRDRNVRRIGWVAAEIARHGGVAVASPIAPFDATRRHVRRLVEEAGGDFVLVHVATPLEECERRDRKGLYARARAGTLAEFTGISSPYEVPDDAEVRIDTSGLAVDEAAGAVLAHLRDHGHLAGGVRA